jgi:hypothetical protein
VAALHEAGARDRRVNGVPRTLASLREGGPDERVRDIRFSRAALTVNRAVAESEVAHPGPHGQGRARPPA